MLEANIYSAHLTRRLAGADMFGVRTKRFQSDVD